MNIKDIFKRKRQYQQTPLAHLPYNPIPPQNQDPMGDFIGNDGDFSENEIHIDRIAGSSLTFSERKVIRLIDGRAFEIKEKSHHLLGTGRIVSDISEVAGRCAICASQAAQLKNAGLINEQQAEAMSFCDERSYVKCSNCNRYYCNAHVKTTPLPDGNTQSWCLWCIERENQPFTMGQKLRLMFIKLPSAAVLIAKYIISFFIGTSKKDENDES